MPDFVHLQVHSEYSFLQSSIKIPALLKETEKLEQKAVALTDNAFMFGILDFYMDGRKKTEPPVKRILGCHIYINTEDCKPNDRTSYHRLTLLAENEIGYKNLLKITSENYTSPEKWSELPSISLDSLKEKSEGLIAIAGDLNSRFGRDVCGDLTKRATKFLNDICNIFDEEHIYFSLQNHFLEQEEMLNDFLRNYAAKNNRQLVVTNNVHYLQRENAREHSALICMELKKKLNEYSDPYFERDEFYLKSADEMYELFPNDTAALENTIKIADRCNVYIKTNVGSEFWPHFPLPTEFSEEYDYLEKLVFKKVPLRYPQKKLEAAKLTTEQIEERVKIELDTIKKMNVPGYFLIIADLIQWAKDNDIPMGPGRGSAAGSIVAYILGITELDPLPYNLLFERFLNPERVSMPDIDIDVSDKDRQRLIDYVSGKYGRANVTQLVTYGRMKAKAVLHAVGRVMDMSLSEVEKFAKRIPFKLPPDAAGKAVAVNLRNVRKADAELSEMIDQTEQEQNFWALSEKLEGLISNSGTHAAAVIIAPRDMTELAPIYSLNKGDIPAIQYDKHYAEDIGLLKMDILGLRNLSMIQEAVKSIKKYRNLEVDILNVNMFDDKTFELFGQGHTVGVFQFESFGMRRYLQQLKPSRLEDLIAMNALYRPGPMEQIPQYIKCKTGQQPIDCFHDNLKSVLQETYGVIVYQEQVMRIVQILAGFSLGKADKLRRAMGKKNAKEMAEMQPEFFKNGIELGYTQELLEKIWETLLPFCDYAFNKSHSATYAFVAYQTAYLKANFPQEYMSAVMSVSPIDDLPVIVDECRRIGIEVLQPDVNKSFSAFVVDTSGREKQEGERAIRWGLSQIKGVGEVVAEDIEKDRLKNGNYKSFFDFVRRLFLFDKVTINKTALESLVKAGAFDCVAGTRAQKFAAVERALADASVWMQNKKSTQISMFGASADVEPSFEDNLKWTFMDELDKEKSVLGAQVSAHPLDEYSAEIRGFCDMNLSAESIKENLDSEEKVTVAGIVSEVNIKTSKTGDRFAIIVIQDKFGKIEAFCGAKKWEGAESKIIKDVLVIVSGKVKNSYYNNSPQLMIDSIGFLSGKIKQAKTYNIKIDVSGCPENWFEEHNKENGCITRFYVEGTKGLEYLLESQKFHIPASKENLKELAEMFGKDNVWVSD
ncbi:DNA-directed DNA polymerase [Fibrobacterales bacterium]|nr:DNA-directed DNA polymerase [Fibrobacterales bacterium]